jgi:hypothetical protein
MGSGLALPLYLLPHSAIKSKETLVSNNTRHFEKVPELLICELGLSKGSRY